MRAWFSGICIAWSGVAGAAPCEGRQQAVAEATEAAAGRVIAADVLGFEREVARVQAEIACLREPVHPSVAAGVHLTFGLWHWAHRQDDAAAASMWAARLVDPGRALPDALFPVGDALRLAFDAPPPLGATVEVRVPAGRATWFDGVATRARPVDRPTLAQVAGRDGLPVVSRVLWPSDPLPSPPWVGKTRRELAVAGGGAAAATLGLYAGAWVAHGRFAQRSPDDIPGLERDAALANGLSIGSVVAALVAVGTGVTAAVLR